MDIPVGAQVFIWGIVVFIGLFGVVAVFTVYEAAVEAREYFKRENERHRDRSAQEPDASADPV